MCNVLDEKTARLIMGANFVGSKELMKIDLFDFDIMKELSVPYSAEELEKKKDDYYLIRGISRFSDGTAVTIRTIQNVVGNDPLLFEPCFYNQDWYMNEDFIDAPMKDGWFFLRKKVYDDSRAKQPSDLIKVYEFPQAIICVYAFFTVCLSCDEKLWIDDYIWCSDVDHNGDRIYVGRYHDKDGINKNGFSIHRHLKLRPCYGCID